MSLGLVVLEEKLFTRTRTRARTPTPQSDDIKNWPSLIFLFTWFFRVCHESIAVDTGLVRLTGDIRITDQVAMDIWWHGKVGGWVNIVFINQLLPLTYRNFTLLNPTGYIS